MTNKDTSSNPNKPIAYSYTRFSSAQQAEGDSKRRQESLTKTWAEAAHYEIRNLHDAGVSAYSGKNRTIGQFGRFLAALRSGELGTKPVLLVENLDRISREELETAQALFLEIVGLGATIITLHNGKRYAKGMGLVDIITALVEMDVAHQHSAKLSMRVKAAVDARKKSGAIVHNRSQSPTWLRLNPARTQFEPIPERVALVQRMFELAAKGMGPQAIAKVFNTERVPSWSSRKSGIRAWRGTMIAKVIYGRSVLGEFDGRIGYFGAGVIAPELWTKVNDRTKKEAQGRGKGIIAEDNLLCGLLVSGLDGSKMILRKSGVKSRKTGEYIWHRYLVSNETVSGRGSHRAKYEPLEARLLWLFGNLDPQMLARAKAGVRDDTQDRLDAALKHVEDTTRQIAKYRRLIENDPDPSMTLVAELKRHETELKSAEAAVEPLKLQSAKATNMPAVTADLTKPENRRALRAEIAQWCHHIELREGEFIVWFSETHGLRVNIEGEPDVREHDLDHAEHAIAEAVATAFEPYAHIDVEAELAKAS
jgi:DNA invertase Pin-like site-specific DNA recombinase